MNLIMIIGILALILVISLIFSRDFRHWLGRQLTGLWLIIQAIAPIIGHFLRVALTAYGAAVVVATYWIFILLTVGILVNWPIVIAICFLLAIILGIIVWLPAGIIMRLFRINSAVLPPTVKALVAYVAFFGFLAFTHPEIVSFKFILGISLIGFMSIGLKTRINFLDKVAWPVVLLICGIIAWSYFWPGNFRATTRWASSLGSVFNTARDRNSINNNTWASVTYGKLKKDVQVVYQAKFQRDTITALEEVNLNLKKDLMVKLVGHKNEIQNFDGAGFIQIQLAKNNGSFVGGQKVWIEADLIEIGTREAIEPEEDVQKAQVSQPTPPVQTIASETIKLHQGEQWFPTHKFKNGESLTLTVKYAPVKHIQGDNSTEIISVGTTSMTMCTNGAPAFEGIDKLSEVTVTYSL